MKNFLGFLLFLLSCESFAQTTPFQTFLLGSPAASTLSGSEVMYCSQSGSSTQCTPNQLLTFINTNGSPNLANSTGTLPAARLPAFTGDITTSAGSSATTLATVNSNVGSFTNSSITVNAKGLITAASSGSSVPTAANPSATVGLTTINGSATTFMRSDGAPSLSQSIVPNWTGVHTFSALPQFNAGIEIAQTIPIAYWNQTGAGTDLKMWDMDVTSGVLSIRTLTDVLGAGQLVFSATRGTTTTLTNETFGNATSNPSYTFAGTGTASFGGAISATNTIIGANGFRVTGGGAGATINGMYLSGTNTLQWVTNSVGRGSIDASGGFNWNAAITAPNLASSSAATTGTVCWTTGTGNFTIDTTVACLASTIKVKQAVKSLDVGLSEVMKLHPVSYDLKPEFNPEHLGRQVGLIAEDVQAIDSRLVGLDSNGDVKGVRYMQLTAVLVRAIQQQQIEIYGLLFFCIILMSWQYLKLRK